MPQTAPYGSWVSPIEAADTIAGLVGFGSVVVNGPDLYWLEQRPSEQGRSVLVQRAADGTIDDLTPDPINVRTAVHEYGGGAYVVRDGVVLFSDFADQRLYRRESDGTISPITPKPPRPLSLRYADADFLPDGRLVCVREEHPEQGDAINTVVVWPNAGSAEPEVITEGRDFSAAPRVSPDGTQIAWLEWDHPNMPWDGTELRVAGVADATSGTLVAGGNEESIVQPEWAPDGSLVFGSDRTGFWNLYRHRDGATTPILPMEADFGDPLWVFRRNSYGFLGGGRILTTYWEHGTQNLAIVDGAGSVRRVAGDYTEYAGLTTDGEAKAWFTGYQPSRPSRLAELDLESGAESTIRSNSMPVPAEYIAEPRVITFPTTGGDVAYGVFYPPCNPNFEGPKDEAPPLVVLVHGGPTSHVSPGLAIDVLYWTTRGLGVVDVNYRGSSGYGREFRSKLDGQWGIFDVDDCVAAAAYLVAEGEADPDRLVITGGSAGGYTTLAALAFRNRFRAGASYYGVADVELLAAHTHKFESRYLDRLVGTDRDLMRKRSPLYSADQIDVPVILFQGLEDRIVPPEQAEAIADVLRERGVPHAHVIYEGEDHGFRKAENIAHSLESELAFYGIVLGFTPADDLPEVPMVEAPGAVKPGTA